MIEYLHPETNNKHNNPYVNHSNTLVKEETFRLRNLLDRIKDDEVRELVRLTIETRCYSAFNQGVQQGQYEISHELKILTNIEEPYF